MTHPFPLKSLMRRLAPLSRFRTARDGATAVEFALIGPVFLALLIAVLQVGIVFFAEQALQSAAVAASRLVLTGQAQSSSMTQAQFLNAICPSVRSLFTCSNIMVDVQNYNSFSSSNYSTPTLTYDGQGNVTNQWSFSPGAAGSIVVVRFIYQWPVIGGPLGFAISNLPNGKRLMMGVSAFRVEPYS
jgi:Flp pilus assembly protein TadG